jgi:hypothetical protein
VSCSGVAEVIAGIVLAAAPPMCPNHRYSGQSLKPLAVLPEEEGHGDRASQLAVARTHSAAGRRD